MLQRYSVYKINKLSRKYEIWCIGCGVRLNEMIEKYKDQAFIKKIVGLLDNNENLWGIKKKIGDSIISIHNPAYLTRYQQQKILLIITSDHVEEIYSGIQDIIEKEQIVCAIYPIYYYGFSEKIMKLCARLPMKNRVLFKAGESPHENADEIVKYLNSIKCRKPIQAVYLGKNTNRFTSVFCIDDNALNQKSSLFQVLKYCFYYATSKYLFYENDPIYKVRNEQKLVYLNHGCFPLKRVNDVLKQPEELDYGICPAPECAKVYEEQYGIPKEKQLYMMPARKNELFNQDVDMDWVSNGSKLIIWLPTFRQLKNSDRRDSLKDTPLEVVGKKENWDYLNTYLEKEHYCLVIKNHPRERLPIRESGNYSAIKILTDTELQEHGVVLNQVLSKSVAMITDYSSVAFEYMLLNRPIGYVVADMNTYIRGFSVQNPLDYMPGEKIVDFAGLLEFISKIVEGQDDYTKERMRVVKNVFGNMKDTDGARMLVELIRHGGI